MSDELAASPDRFRALTGAPATLLRVLLISLTVLGSLWALEVHNYFEITFFKQQYLALFLALALGSVFLAVKPHSKQTGDSVPWYDWLLALIHLVKPVNPDALVGAVRRISEHLAVMEE